jgi:hypothetical protein
MSTTVSSDVAYVLKNLDEIQGGSHKRKHDFLVQYDDESLDGNNHLTKEETQSQPKVEVGHLDDTTYRTLVRILTVHFFSSSYF